MLKVVYCIILLNYIICQISFVQKRSRVPQYFLRLFKTADQNGGLHGHIARLLKIAREFPPDCDVILLTNQIHFRCGDTQTD